MESVRKRIASHRVITIYGCLFHPIFWLYFFSKLVWPQNVFRIVQLVLNSINKLFQRMLFFAMSLLRFFTDGPFLSFQSLRITLSVIKTYQNPVQLLLWDSSSFRHICWDTCIWIQMKLLFDYTFWTFMEVFSGPKCFSFFLALQRSSVINTAFWAPPAEIQSFHANRCLRKFLEGFTLNQLSDWKLSEHAVKFARDLQTRLSNLHSYRHTFTHTDSPSEGKSEPWKNRSIFLKV